jgi:Alkylmercury lyase
LASGQVGQRWVAEHPGAFLLSVQDAFQLGRQTNRLLFGAGLTGASNIQVFQAASGDTRTASAARLSAPARALHLAILRAFADTGRPPSPSELDQHRRALGVDADAAMAELVADDTVVLDRNGAVVAAYPFSATPTLHHVEVHSGATVYAMCAVDALGMSAMLARPVTIAAREPDTGLQVLVRVDGEQATFEPATTVVYAGTTGDWCCGPAAQQRCGTINFFTTTQAASAWAARHTEVTGQILDQQQALAWGIQEFAGLLAPHR